jgi:hypothetical protein
MIEEITFILKMSCKKFIKCDCGHYSKDIKFILGRLLCIKCYEEAMIKIPSLKELKIKLI